jgi:hypothetical protein
MRLPTEKELKEAQKQSPEILEMLAKLFPGTFGIGVKAGEVYSWNNEPSRPHMVVEYIDGNERRFMMVNLTNGKMLKKGFALDTTNIDLEKALEVKDLVGPVKLRL